LTLNGYVNGFIVTPISVSERVPQLVQFLDLNVGDTNTVISLTRFDLATPTAVGIVVTGAATITANIATISTIWNTANDTPYTGQFRLQLQCQNPTGTIVREANLIYTVLQ